MKKLFAVMLFACSSAFAFDYEVGIGATRFDETNGIFYYENLPHENKLTSPSFSFGVADRIYGQRFRFGYQYFGHVEQKSTIYAWSSSGDGNCHADTVKCGPAFRWEGEGTTQAIYLQWEPEYKRGNWRLFAGFGPTLIKARFQEKVLGGSAPGTTIDSPGDYRVKWLGFSIGVEYKNIAVVYQHQPVSSSAECTFVTKADTVSMRVRF